MSTVDAALGTFWGHPELAFRWRLCLELEPRPITLVADLLERLPENLAELVFLDHSQPEPFVVLCTYDLENPGAAEHLTQILYQLLECGVFRLIGVEGSLGEMKGVTRWRQYPDAASRDAVARHLLAKSLLTPIEVAALAVTMPVLPWGIEDRELYLRALEAYRAGTSDYGQLIDRRAPVLVDNLLAKMSELGVTTAGASLTEYNFNVAHRLLQDRGVAHASIRARSKGPSKPGLLHDRLHDLPHDEDEARLFEAFSPELPADEPEDAS